VAHAELAERATRVSSDNNDHNSIPTHAVAGNSPSSADVPFWVTAFVRLDPPQREGKQVSPLYANAVILAVQALLADRVRTEGNAEVPLNRDRIARRCGLGSAKKAKWLFDYLQKIKFLKITHHYRGPHRGRSHDTFTVYDQPPFNYVGPRTHAALEHALDNPAWWTTGTLLVGETPGQPQGHGSGTLVEDLGHGSGTLVDKTPGQPQGHGSGTFSRARRSDSSSLRSERDRREEGASEPEAGRWEAPGTGSDEDDASAAAYRLARRLPWTEWSTRTGKPLTITADDLDRVATAVADAIHAGRATFQDAESIAPAALAEASKNPVNYVVGAFKGARLVRWVRSTQAVELDEDPLPLPSATGDDGEHNTPTEALSSPQAATQATSGVLPACGQCDAREGEPASVRTVVDDNGNGKRCDCLTARK